MSGFLLDTNVVSELVRVRPEPRVVTWIDGAAEPLLHLSVLTLGEIRKGVALLTDGRRQALLEAWVESDLKARFAGRVLGIGEAITDRWGVLSAEAQARGRGLGVIDGLLAATAVHHNLTLVTRNVRDFESLGCGLFDPWAAI